MTELELRKKFVSTAESYLGYNEGDGSHKKIIDLYNTQNPLPRGYKVKYTDAWCATYVSAMGIAAGLSDIIYPECSCGQMIKLYQAANAWVENDNYVPQMGDIIFYDLKDTGNGDNTEWPGHVGLITGVSGSTLNIIDGNWGDAVARRTLPINGKTIRGFGTPKYASKATPSKPAPTPVPQPSVLLTGIINNNLDLVSAAKSTLLYKTLYVNGCFGAPMNNSNKQRYCNNTDYNKKPERTAKIMAASSDTFGFDCICFIKGLLWGWKGDTSKEYGGAIYQSNGVPDIGTKGMLNACLDISEDFSRIEIGEYLWIDGHCGIYIGNGKAIECTHRWDDGVQETYVFNILGESNNKGRYWTKHGKLPYIPYVSSHICSFTSKITKAATCVSEGVKTFMCTCGKSYTEAIPKTNHIYNNGKITTQATCTQKGIKTFTCACGKSYTEEIPMLAHNYTKQVIAPTCEKDGYTINTCSCGHSFNNNITKAIGHNYTIDIIAPTYEEKGYNLNTCKNCGNTYKDAWVDCLVNPEPEIIEPIPIIPDVKKEPEITPIPEVKPEPEIIEPTPIIPEITPTNPEEENTPSVPMPDIKPQPAPIEEEIQWEIGDEAKILAGARFATGKEILSWIVANKVYIRDFRENESAVISTQKLGPITGIVYLKDLIPYSKDIYDVNVTSNLLNVRKEPKADATIINQIKKDTKHTIIEEENGWGHIANSGWINLQYVKKV